MIVTQWAGMMQPDWERRVRKFEILLFDLVSAAHNNYVPVCIITASQSYLPGSKHSSSLRTEEQHLDFMS